ncbi:MAG: thioredoxin family protein [Cyanophyceae cyanobacterium]
MSPSSDPANAINSQMPAYSNRLRNVVIAVVAVVLAIALGLGLQGQSRDISLEQLAEQSVPLDGALNNNKPTLVEFYADWCTSCRAMAGDMAELRDVYGDRVNFTMLNVDNAKWLPEILSYRVDGIPHFVYLDANGQELGQASGEQPRLILAENLEAMTTSEPLPHVSQAIGQTSEFQPTLSGGKGNPSSTDPRSHSSQVVSGT